MPRRLAFALLLSAAPGLAQRLVLTDTTVQPVVVESLGVSTEVTGRLAVTTYDLVFYNPNPRVLEGTLEFPLLDGQRVVRFALDVDGRLREAVPVEKTKARVVFEEIERRQVDPGLVELTAGNNYRARIYPVPAQGRRRVVIAYQEDLGRGGNGMGHYRIALDFPDALKTFGLRVAVTTGESAPVTARTTLPLEWPAWDGQQVLQIERTNFTARGVVELTLPPIRRALVVTEARGTDHYFYAEVPVPARAAVARPAPQVVGLLWDASGSGAERDHTREYAFLEAWFAAVPEVTVRLVALRDQAAAVQPFTIRRGDWRELRRALERMEYDGATSFDGLVDHPEVEEWLLFSDGLINYGATREQKRLPLRAPVHTVVASVRAHPAALRSLAREHAGEAVDLLRRDPVEAARLVRQASPRVWAIERNPQAVSHVFPEVGTPVTDDVLLVTGILREARGTLQLRVGATAADAQVIEVVLTSGAAPGQLAGRAWATAKINALESRAEDQREDLRRTAEAFGIVTATTSLLVLETLDDYVRYAIEPPAELRDGWLAQQRRAVIAQQKARDTHLTELAQQLAERVAWWERRFPKGPRPEPAPRDKVRDAEQRGAVMEQEQRREAAAAPRVAALNAAAPPLAAFALAADRSAASIPGAAAMRPEEHPETALGASVTLVPWSPRAAYLERLQRASAADVQAVYLEERADHRSQPGFYLDVAEFFFARGETPFALRVLSNLAELGLEEPALLRVLGHRLLQAGRADLAQPVFAHVLRIRDDEPHSRRDLALASAALGQFQRAVDLLAEVVNRPWDQRFAQIGLIALGELNALVATGGQPLDLSAVDPRLRRNLPVGLRVVLSWDANDCDIDLWVDDPNGEKAYYGHALTHQGGHMSRDFTQGYGPEEFLLRDPKPGTYTLRINYYGDQRQTALGPVTAQVRVITGFGTPEAREQILTVRLTGQRETLEIGSVQIGPASKSLASHAHRP